MERVTQFLQRRCSWLLALGLGGSAELLVKLEWSFPYCNDPQDGPAAAVYGFPFPYLQWSGTSSLVYDFALPFYMLNLALQTTLWFLVVHAIVRRLIPDVASPARGSIGLAGAVLCTGFLAIQILLVATGLRTPVAALNSPSWDAYVNLRPIGLTTTVESACSAYEPQ